METCQLENSEMVLSQVHAEGTCVGDTCPVHKRTEHHMRSFEQVFRDDRGFMERRCEHGIGHPDPDDVFADPVHGCDGCCQKPLS